MTSIKHIDNQLDTVFKKLTQTTQTIAFEEVATFTIKNTANVISREDLLSSGIYFIEIKCNPASDTYNKWIKRFEKKWNAKAYQKKNTPTLQKNKIQAHKELKEWMPLYLGKSRKIANRINQHFHLKLNQSTSALKLAARENLKEELFRLSVFKLEITNYDAIMPRIEKQLRDQFLPLIGRQ